MRAAVVAIVATVVMIGGALAWPAPADAAGTPGCATRAEFSRLHRGMSPFKVQQIIGASGKVQTDDRSPGYRYLSKTYRVCGSRYGSVLVAFTGDPAPLGLYAKGFYA